ncbi:SMI1/KNR4 family protein [Phytohabitans sp. ZYX-F-186]|uniref:SMI1/KNR4 family protein n=1 Tax=Phytohabitans maris TaxID=3071409 RepID=A0ABU0ZQN0_9ACTN|nr:SMI1/KNR4 family protein [Phytohabitans sp. ZYX-F-186]MDQ7909328.1 SMI1/KNR4 family protein [Phytohabitans sp. ZYX-F-186]
MASANRQSNALERALDDITTRIGCHLRPPVGPPRIPVGLAVPDDLRELYRRCGGATLFEDAPYPWRVSGPDELVAASPRLLTPDIAEEIAATDPSDLTNGCFVIADGGTGTSTEPHIVIDLHPARAGLCYLAGWDTYGLVGDMPIVADGIAELLQRLLATNGQQPAPPGPYHGDAYEEHLRR